ncbi:MAG TPA: family 43 glycosylhydrolase, partial [Acidimicrobiales bacterium]|nr:family 43 glycosylhydrolase [Acidimicrobiales bacterium]
MIVLTVAVLLTAGAGAGLALSGRGSVSAPAPVDGTGGSSGSGGVADGGTHRAPVARAIGQAVGQSLPGTVSTYYQPPGATAAETATPAQMMTTGRDAPDPFVLLEGGRYYLYTSQGDQTGDNVPLATGRSMAALGPLTDAMPTLPGWAVPGFTWAPDVRRFGDHYVLYFTSIVAGTDPSEQCIGIATGTSPAGPF